MYYWIVHPAAEARDTRGGSATYAMRLETSILCHVKILALLWFYMADGQIWHGRLAYEAVVVIV